MFDPDPRPADWPDKLHQTLSLVVGGHYSPEEIFVILSEVMRAQSIMATRTGNPIRAACLAFYAEHVAALPDAIDRPARPSGRTDHPESFSGGKDHLYPETDMTYGHWKTTSPEDEMEEEEQICRCEICGEDFNDEEYSRCPNCGAFLDGEPE